MHFQYLYKVQKVDLFVTVVLVLVLHFGWNHIVTDVVEVTEYIYKPIEN